MTTPISTRSLGVATLLLLATALPYGVQAAPLTFTDLFNPVEIHDPKNVVASIMLDLWKDDIAQVPGASYEFMYSSFDANGSKYLVSMMVSPLCGSNACSWYVQRVSPSFKVQATGQRIDACADRNTVDATAGKLTICGRSVPLP